MFRQMNLKKPTKWFLNMAREKISMDSPSNRDELLNDFNYFYANIFKTRERQPGVSMEKFVGDLKAKPEVFSKKLTEE